MLALINYILCFVMLFFVYSVNLNESTTLTPDIYKQKAKKPGFTSFFGFCYLCQFQFKCSFVLVVRNGHLSRHGCYVSSQVSGCVRDRINSAAAFAGPLSAETERCVVCSDRRILNVVNRIAIT